MQKKRIKNGDQKSIPPEVISPEALIQRYAAGEQAAFDALYQQFKQYVARCLRRKVKNTSDIKDLTQEIFIKVAKGAKSFNHDSSFKSWLHKIMSNHLIDHFRKNSSYKKSGRRGAQSLFDENETLIIDTATDNTYDNPVKTLYEKEYIAKRAQFIEQFIQEKKLSPLKQKILFLELRGFDQAQIAEALTKNYNTVRWNLFDIRKQMKAFAEKKDIDFFDLCQ